METNKERKLTYLQVVVAIHVLLLIVDRLPFLQLAFSVLCHGVYTLNLKTFPFISLTSVPFIASCGMCMIFFLIVENLLS